MYYMKLKNKRGLLTSDQTLVDSDLTKRTVLKNDRHNAIWRVKFAKAMVHMGSIQVLTGFQAKLHRHRHRHHQPIAPPSTFLHHRTKVLLTWKFLSFQLSFRLIVLDSAKARTNILDLHDIDVIVDSLNLH
ncbi:unnamed protein product [Vicia faba]|uniref:peroxidase n=1 Tax=Vicia faba TaxID=3906 RepID=A0AAV0ZZ59_VICFA|nr:unnamed protein product [Vicia faba]